MELSIVSKPHTFGPQIVGNQKTQTTVRFSGHTIFSKIEAPGLSFLNVTVVTKIEVP